MEGKAPDPAVLAKDRKRKQKEEAKSQRAAKKQKDAPARNTAIFVSRLPLDPPVTADELAQVFSKAGMILQDVDSNPKIKLYNDQVRLRRWFGGSDG
jgi:HIV Tat-specific factor 1